MRGLSVLSFGFTRGLWDGKGAEDYERMMQYARHLDDYVVVTNSYKKHRLESRQLAPGFDAIPTNAYNPLDSFLRMLGIGRAVLRARRIDIIQAQDPFFCGLAAILLGRLFRLPVNVCVYGPNVYDPHWQSSHWIHRVLGPIGRWVLKRCSCIQVDGWMTARSLVAAGCSADRVEVKPMVPANIDEFLTIPRGAPHDGPLRLLFVGRLCPQKNLPLLLEVVQSLRTRSAVPFELVLVGEGPDESALRAIVERDGLTDCVHFRGSVARAEIAAEFARADIFVLSSDYEGYPRVLMEAAAAALPIVTTAVSGSDEAVADGESGYIVPIRSAEALVEKLALLLGDDTARVKLGARARERMREKLDPATNTPGQVAIWKKIMHMGQPSAPAEQARPRRLLLFNLVTDASHPILGFTSQWIRALAARVDSIDVLTMRAGVIDLPANVRVHSVGAEQGYSELRRAFNFYRHLIRIIRERRPDGCFSHMMPEFSGLGGPLLRACGIPLVTWYAHPSLTLPVKVAHFFSNRMVTSLPGAYPYRKDKLSVIGQGIDTELFAPAPEQTEEAGRILCVGRLSRVKNHSTLLQAMATLPSGTRLVILGATASKDDEAYAAELREKVHTLGLGSAVTFAPPVAATELPAHYRKCAVHVNLTPAGFGDKVAWEAMSCARPCIVANADFAETLGEHREELLFALNDPQDLAAKLRALLLKSPAERAEIGRYLRAQVERLHSLPRLAERILDELSSCRKRSA
jgi:glycosyltransferase involved in cell wall biosynthesis